MWVSTLLVMKEEGLSAVYELTSLGIGVGSGMVALMATSLSEEELEELLARNE